MALKAAAARKLLRGAAVGLGSTALALAISLTGLLEGFEARTWDWRVQLLADEQRASGEVAVLLLDQESLDWGSDVNALPWPWPREVYTYLISFCRRAGVRALVFDVVFSEPSGYGVYDDQALVAAVADLGVFVGTVFLSREDGEDEWPAYVPTLDIAMRGLDAWLAGTESQAYPKATFPIPILASEMRAAANVQLEPDPDSIFRRAPLLTRFDDSPVPSPALAAYAVGRAAERGAGAALEVVFRGRRLTVDDTVIPLDAEGSAVLNYRGPSGSHATYSAASIIQSEIQIQSGEEPNVNPDLLAGKYVFFGFSAPGLLDLRPSPVAGVYAGVEIHATMMDNLLTGGFIRELPLGWSIALNVLLVFLAGILASLASRTYHSILLYLLFLPLPVALGLLAYLAGVWVPIMVLEVSVLLALIASSLINYFTEGRQKRYIKGAFSQYLSPAVIEELILDPDRLELGGERRELSIFFSDLEGFTGISEGLSPEELTALLNEYLSAMTDVILESGGTIDKYEGDAIIAFWNAPIDQDDHADRAVRTALLCQAVLADMRPGFRERIGKELRMRIGINTGPAVVGNMGSRSRFDYTMLGDAVNLASRLEGANKQFGTYTMISQNTQLRAGEAHAARELSRIAVVGRAEPVTVFEPLSAEEAEKRGEQLAAFAEGLALFYAGDFAEAGGVFSRIAEEDPAAAAYVRKCGELASAPPADWGGVWLMSEK